MERERRHPHDDRRREGGHAEPQATPPHALLALQRSAGNRAVAGMLSRDKDAEDDRPTSITLGMGRLGVIPLDSTHFDRDHELGVAFVTSPIAPQFMGAAAKGEKFDTVWLSSPAMRSTMTDVYISRVTESGNTGGRRPLISATLNFAEIKHEPRT